MAWPSWPIPTGGYTDSSLQVLIGAARWRLVGELARTLWQMPEQRKARGTRLVRGHCDPAERRSFSRRLDFAIAPFGHAGTWRLSRIRPQRAPPSREPGADTMC